MKKIKSLSWTGICCALLFIFNVVIVFIGIRCNQIWYLVGGILLSLFQCWLYNFYKLKSNTIQQIKHKHPAHIPVSFHHRPTGLDINASEKVYPDGHKKVDNIFFPGAN